MLEYECSQGWCGLLILLEGLKVLLFLFLFQVVSNDLTQKKLSIVPELNFSFFPLDHSVVHDNENTAEEARVRDACHKRRGFRSHECAIALIDIFA